MAAYSLVVFMDWLIQMFADYGYLGMGLLALVLAGMVDCHMFNMGPGLTYGVMPLFAEMLPSGESAQQPLLQQNN